MSLQILNLQLSSASDPLPGPSSTSQYQIVMKISDTPCGAVSISGDLYLLTADNPEDLSVSKFYQVLVANADAIIPDPTVLTTRVPLESVSINDVPYHVWMMN